LYPYDRKGKLLPPSVALSDPVVLQHFQSHKDDLLKGKPEYPTYYEYGRTQALLDVWRKKIAINVLLRTEKDLKIEEVDEGQGVYSGLYIITDYGIPFKDIKQVICSHEFAVYVSLLKKYKSGGYYTFNTKDVEQYVNYMLSFKSPRHYALKSKDSE
jgi:adenine-specific DNA-methyltransferase